MPESTPAVPADALPAPEPVASDAEAARILVEQRARWRREGREYLEENFDKTLAAMLRANALVWWRRFGAIVIGLSLIGGSVHLAAGNWDQPALLLLVLGGVAGAPLGALAAGRIPAKPLRTGLLLWSALLGGVLLVQGLFCR